MLISLLSLGKNLIKTHENLVLGLQLVNKRNRDIKGKKNLQTNLKAKDAEERHLLIY